MKFTHLNRARSVTALLSAVIALPTIAHADATPAQGLSGEGSLSASQTTGNSSTTVIGAGLKLSDHYEGWLVNGVLNADYGRNNGVTSINDQYASLQAGRDLNSTVYVYGKLSDTRNRFIGYFNQFFVGAGVGAHVLKGPQLTWTVEAAPGYETSKLVHDWGTQHGIAGNVASKLAYKVNDKVSLANDTNLTFTHYNTLDRILPFTTTHVILGSSSTLDNTTSATAKLGAKLALRVSYEVNHQTSALPGFKSTNTYSKFSLVYGF